MAVADKNEKAGGSAPKIRDAIIKALCAEDALKGGLHLDDICEAVLNSGAPTTSTRPSNVISVYLYRLQDHGLVKKVPEAKKMWIIAGEPRKKAIRAVLNRRALAEARSSSMLAVKTVRR